VIATPHLSGIYSESTQLRPFPDERPMPSPSKRPTSAERLRAQTSASERSQLSIIGRVGSNSPERTQWDFRRFGQLWKFIPCRERPDRRVTERSQWISGRSWQDPTAEDWPERLVTERSQLSIIALSRSHNGTKPIIDNESGEEPRDGTKPISSVVRPTSRIFPHPIRSARARVESGWGFRGDPDDLENVGAKAVA
jgi:hypothetical protein